MRAGNMNKNSNIQQDVSTSGYNPNIQMTTGTYCVTSFNSQTSNKPYSEYSSSGNG